MCLLVHYMYACNAAHAESMFIPCYLSPSHPEEFSPEFLALSDPSDNYKVAVLPEHTSPASQSQNIKSPFLQLSIHGSNTDALAARGACNRLREKKIYPPVCSGCTEERTVKAREKGRKNESSVEEITSDRWREW
ncbi:hypothetical protein BS50DRAFT_584750 [Corynespora cassiicola Philippines]|uniref:Uncharacterized protein n=1 Tax=Corynespora cassiicola Philippines TaxID=1448308 RepID=A0A2T2P0S6_CORCC|nr:hypothetical protein BS50DRAFT_584750 [Corynespora cassiicola Philippines]